MSDVLHTAYDLVRGERARNYGPPHDNFAVIADLWSTYIVQRVRKELERSPSGQIPTYGFLDGNDVANLMSLLKIAREASGLGYHEDSTVDVCGYQAIKELLQLPRGEFIKQQEEQARGVSPADHYEPGEVIRVKVGDKEADYRVVRDLHHISSDEDDPARFILELESADTRGDDAGD